MFDNLNKLLYQIVFSLYDYEGIQALIVYDTRDRTIILNDLFHLFDNEENGASLKDIFINKIKNKELNIPLIDDNFIKILNDIEKIRKKVIDLINLNNISKLKHYFIKHDLLISYINHDDFDLLIYAIQNNVSMDMIKVIISFYKSLNYSINTENEDKYISLNNLIIDSIDILMNDDYSFLLRLSYLNKILNEFESKNEKNYYTPLYCAISNNNYSVGKLLLKNNANMDFKLNGQDIISTIIKNGKWNELNLKFILKDYFYIYSNGFITLIKNLIKKNEDIDDLLNIILNFYICDISFIIRLLSIYKNKIKLSKNQLNTLFINGSSKIPIEWLFQAIDNDDIDLVKLLISHGINTNKKLKTGESPLFKALKINSIIQYNDEERLNEENLKIISYLIQNNANVNEILNNGDNILIYAIKRNSINIIKDLISHGADIFNERSEKKSNTAISIALETGRDEVIKYLIEYIVAHNQNEILQDSNLINLSIENCNENITVLLIEKGTKIDNKICIANAIYMDYSNSTVKYLIEHGADIYKKGNCNKTPLHIAVENKKEDIIKYLIDHGVKYNNNEDSLILSIAIKNNINKSSIQYLIEHIVEINESLKYDLSKSLINAIHNNDESLVKYLVDHGADVNFNNNNNNNNNNTSDYSPLGLAFHNKNESIIKYLIEQGACINSKIYETTPLTYAFQNFNESFIKYIIDKGADVNYKDDKNNTPLYYAVSKCSEKIITYLIDHGAKICSDVNISDALHKNLNETIIQYLINNGAGLNNHSNAYYGPLTIAIKNNYSDTIIKSMIEHGANVNEINNKRFIDETDKGTPIKIAVNKKRLNVIQYLLDHNVSLNGLKRVGERSFITLIEKNNKNIEKYFIKQNICKIEKININNNDDNDKKKGKKTDSSSSVSVLSSFEKYNKNSSETLMKYLIKKKTCKRKRKRNNKNNLTENEHKTKKRKNDNDINLDEYLIEAIENNYNEILIRSLIDHGADVKDGLALIKAIENYYSETIIQSILDHGANVNVKGENGKTPLTLAIVNSNEIVIKMIIEHGAEVNEKGENDQYPINLALKNFNESLVQLLIDHGAKIREDTPLNIALENKFSENLILYLIEHGANLKFFSILNIAYINNYSNTVLKSLIDHGVSITSDYELENKNSNYFNIFYNEKSNGIKLLAKLIENNNKELVKYIFNHKKNIVNKLTDSMCSLLSFAINSDCNIKLIKFLIKHTNKNKIEEINSFSPIRVALNRKNLNLLIYLHEHGFNIHDTYHDIENIFELNDNIVKYMYRQNPNYFYNKELYLNCKEDQYKENKELIKYFINHKISDMNNDRLLKIAIKNDDKNLIEYLINHGIQINIKLINRAIKNKNLNLVKELIDYGIDINNINNESKRTNYPLVIAIKYKQLDIIKYLISHGANLNIKDKEENTLLQLAIDLGDEKIFKYLLDQGIELKINDKKHTPLTYAIKTKKLNIAKYLMYK